MDRFKRLCLAAVVLLLVHGAMAAKAQTRRAALDLPLAAVAVAPEAPCAAPQPAGANHRGATLKNANFAYQDLSNADFSGATLDGVVFIGANLTGASFGGAVFTNQLNGSQAANLPTDFTSARLSHACFVGAQFKATNAPVYFTDAELSCANFSGTDIGNLNAIFGPSLTLQTSGSCRTAFRQTVVNCEFVDQWRLLDLSHADVSACKGGFYDDKLKKGPDFSNAMMNGVDLFQANLRGANLNNAQLHGVDLSYADLSDATLIGAQLGVAPGSDSGPVANLVGAYMRGADLTDADLRSANLTGVHLYGQAKLLRTRLDSADLSGALLSEAAFSGSLTNATFNNAMLVNANFNGANLSSAKFNSAYLQGADFSTATSVDGVSLNNAAVATAAGYWSFTEQDGTPYTYGYGATSLGAMATGSGAFCPSNQPSPCTGAKLVPSNSGPFPPIAACVPKPPNYDNCLPPKKPG